MATVIPFAAVRPAAQKASQVVSRPYEQYTAEEIEKQLRNNPYSFLHVIHPGYPVAYPSTGEERYATVRNNYLAYIQNHIFIKDAQPAYYIYKITSEDQTVCGIIGAVSTEDYRNKIVRKHEDTLQKREQLFKNYLSAVRFNAEPVLLMYPDNAHIEDIMATCMITAPETEFTDDLGRKHQLWKCTEPQALRRLQNEFYAMPAVYIADGHHRTASSWLLAEEINTLPRSNNGKQPAGFFMSYLVPESQLKLYEFNRLVKDLNGLSKETFLEKLQTTYHIENAGKEIYKPIEKHQFSMYLDGTFYRLQLRHNYPFTNALTRLDPYILYVTVLRPILGITDLRNDKRLEYTSGKDSLARLKKLVDEGLFAVGFGLTPVTAAELKEVADAGLQMPPKSTYITPKLLSGLTIYEF